MSKKKEEKPLWQTLNDYRIIPRAILASYGWIMIDVIHWFQNLSDPSTSQAGFVATVVGTFGAIAKFYVESGGGDYGE